MQHSIFHVIFEVHKHAFQCLVAYRFRFLIFLTFMLGRCVLCAYFVIFARGVLSVIILERLLQLCGNRPLSDLFDLVAGTSIGALTAAMVLFSDRRPGPLAHQFLDLIHSVVRLPVTDTLANVVKYRAVYGVELTKMLE